MDLRFSAILDIALVTSPISFLLLISFSSKVTQRLAFEISAAIADILRIGLTILLDMNIVITILAAIDIRASTIIQSANLVIPALA